MTTLLEAAQQALEAWDGGDVKWFANCYRVMDALRAALEQPEQEPVAWMVYTEDGKSAYVTDNPHDLVGAYKAFSLYTHPPRREWRGLTDEEIYPLYSEPSSDAEMVEFARAIEATLKEKNHE